MSTAVLIFLPLQGGGQEGVVATQRAFHLARENDPSPALPFQGREQKVNAHA